MASKKKPKYAEPSPQLREALEEQLRTFCGSRYERALPREYQSLDLRNSIGFRRARLDNAVFTDCHLEDALLWETDLQCAVFRRCNLRGADFTRSYLRWAKFEDCDLRETFFQDANLSGTRFVGNRYDHQTFFAGANMDDFDIICVDNSRHYQMRVLRDETTGPLIVMGCRTFTLNQAWTHWQKNKGGVRQNYLDALKAFADVEGHKLKIVKVPT